MNAFTNYTPKVTLADVARGRKISQARTKIRQAALKSEDADVRKLAEGNLGKLSKRGGRK